jgi:hypothetical protein
VLPRKIPVVGYGQRSKLLPPRPQAEKLAAPAALCVADGFSPSQIGAYLAPVIAPS